MESTAIEYEMGQKCEIEKVGGLIDNKGYGIALPRSKFTLLNTLFTLFNCFYKQF